MSTMALRKRAAKKRAKPQHQADDVYIPESIRKQPDPIQPMCGERFNPVVIYLLSAATALAGGIFIGWCVWG